MPVFVWVPISLGVVCVVFAGGVLLFTAAYGFVQFGGFNHGFIHRTCCIPGNIGCILLYDQIPCIVDCGVSEANGFWNVLNGICCPTWF